MIGDISMMSMVKQRFSVLLACLLFASAASASAKTTINEATNYYLRVSAPEAAGAKLETVLIPSRKKEMVLERTKIGKDGFSGWVRVPRIMANGGKSLLYSGVVLKLMRGRNFVPSATVSMELAATPNGKALQSLPARNVEGGVVTAAIDACAPESAPQMFWFTDHLDKLEATLDQAGFKELGIGDFGGIHVNYGFAIKRFSTSSMMTRDPRVFAQLKRLGRKLGGNCGMFGEPWLNEDSFSVGYNFVTGGKNKGAYVPVDEDWPERIRVFWEKYRLKISEISPDGQLPDIIKIGDEVGFVYAYTNSPAFRRTFESVRVKIAPDLPSNVSISQVDGKDPVRPASRQDRLARYVAMRALNQETVNVYKKTTDAAKDMFGSQVKTKVNLLAWYYGGGFAKFQTWRLTPDYFLLAREGAVDYPEIQGLTPYYPPSGPFSMALLAPMFAAQVRELNTRAGGGSSHMMFPCRSEESSFAHVFMSALLNGNTDLSLYTLGFRASGWEWADVPEKWLEIARCTHWLPKAAEYLKGQVRAKADIAILLSESTDLWQTDPNAYSKSEMRGCAYALKFSGYRMDFLREHLVEDGFLDKYRLLWVTMRNVNGVVRRKIQDWVKAGGILVLTPGALTHDEADDPIDTFDRFRARKCPLPENVSEFDFVKTQTSSPTLENSFGKGRIISFPYMAGMNFCAGSACKKIKFRDETIVQSGLDELNGTVRYGIPYWMNGDETVRSKIDDVVKSAGIRRQAELSSGNVDVGVLDDGRRAFVGIANYGISPVEHLEITIPLKKCYRSVETLNGENVKITWNGTTAKCMLRLVDAQALLFK